MNTIGIGLSGMGAAMRQLDSAAFDVARAASQRTGQASAAEAVGGGANGPAPAAVPAAPPAAPAPEIGTQPRAAEDPNLPAAMVGMISASNAVLANLQTIRRADEAMDAILTLR